MPLTQCATCGEMHDLLWRLATKTLLSGPVSMSSGEGKVSLSADGTLLAGAAEDFTTPPHIGAGPVASPRQITHENDALTPQVAARSIHWKNEGFDVQGWLTGPATAAGPATASLCLARWDGARLQPVAVHEPLSW